MRFPKKQVTIIDLRNDGLDLYGQLDIEPAKMRFAKTDEGDSWQSRPDLQEAQS